MSETESKLDFTPSPTKVTADSASKKVKNPNRVATGKALAARNKEKLAKLNEFEESQREIKGAEQGADQGVEQGAKQGVEQGAEQGVKQGIKEPKLQIKVSEFQFITGGLLAVAIAGIFVGYKYFGKFESRVKDKSAAARGASAVKPAKPPMQKCDSTKYDSDFYSDFLNNG